MPACRGKPPKDNTVFIVAAKVNMQIHWDITGHIVIIERTAATLFQIFHWVPH